MTTSDATDAAGTALVDQAQAAGRHGLGFMRATAERLGGRMEMMPLGGPRAVMVAMFGLAAADERLTLCPHLSPVAPQPQLWAAWRPHLLGCYPCGLEAASGLAGTDEDNRCDHCGEMSATIHPGQLLVPGLALPELLIASGPTVLLFGLCPSCYLASGNPLSATESAEQDPPRGTGHPQTAYAATRTAR